MLQKLENGGDQRIEKVASRRGSLRVSPFASASATCRVHHCSVPASGAEGFPGFLIYGVSSGVAG